MAKSCGKCGRERPDVMIGGRLQRCRESQCPLRGREGAGAGLGLIAILLLLGGGTIAGGVMLWSNRTPPPRGAHAEFDSLVREEPGAPASTQTFSQSASNAPAPFEGPAEKEGFFSSLFSSPKRAEASGPANLSALPPGLIRPSFSCDGTRAALALICADPELAILDRNINLRFIDELGNSPHPARLRRAHAEFQRSLASLPANEDAIRAHYQRWAESLAADAGS